MRGCVDSEQSCYKEKRNLDGVYFRVERDGKWDNVCFSDLTKEERNKVMEGRNIEWLKQLCNYLGDVIYSLGEGFDIFGEEVCKKGWCYVLHD